MIEGAGGVEVPKALFYAIIHRLPFCGRRGQAACLFLQVSAGGRREILYQREVTNVGKRQF